MNEGLKKELKSVILGGRLVHAYLIAGGTPEERNELGLWFANALACKGEDKPCGSCIECRKFADGNSEDFISVELNDDKKSILVSQIEELENRLKFKPVSDRYVILVKDGDLMNAAAQNKLLKTLEEPVSEAVIIILAQRSDALFETVRSRCVSYFLNSPEEEKGAYMDAARKLAGMISDPVFYTKKALLDSLTEEKSLSKDEALDFLGCFELAIKEALLAGGDADSLFAAADAAAQARMYIVQLHNVNYTLRQMCLII